MKNFPTVYPIFVMFALEGELVKLKSNLQNLCQKEKFPE